MSRTLAYLSILICTSALVVISICAPSHLSNQNAFLSDFVGPQFLSILGVILAITLASVANLHLAFNRIEEVHKKRGAFIKSRQNLKKAASWLIGLFIAGTAVVVVKPIAAHSDVSEALFNSASLIILLCHILILISLTELVFKIEPEFS